MYNPLRRSCSNTLTHIGLQLDCNSHVQGWRKGSKPEHDDQGSRKVFAMPQISFAAALLRMASRRLRDFPVDHETSTRGSCCTPVPRGGHITCRGASIFIAARSCRARMSCASEQVTCLGWRRARADAPSVLTSARAPPRRAVARQPPQTSSASKHSGSLVQCPPASEWRPLQARPSHAAAPARKAA